MRKAYELCIDDIAPTAEEVLAQQKMSGRAPAPKILQLLDRALDMFHGLAKPLGVMQDLPDGEFPALYRGRGMNAPDGPVPSIVAQADSLAAMAATMGDALAAKSSELFASGGAALGYMMDAVNSCGAEKLGRRMCALYLAELQAPDGRRALPPEKPARGGVKAQYYCPGHCGWHISGQEALFAALRPEDIGMSLNARWIMFPFKSISGVVVAASIEAHRFQPGFSFCFACRERKCVERLKRLEAA
ncbi:MAG: hypothetical protein LBT74_13465 [Acidobacteriota bacterium]|jgi:hypothetical protein|nr:hypothetical protein [Acidobacteriota bacterium]